jgi:hypothetical protein
MVAQFSRAVIQRTVPDGEALEKPLEPLEGHKYNIVDVSTPGGPWTDE